MRLNLDHFNNQINLILIKLTDLESILPMYKI